MKEKPDTIVRQLKDHGRQLQMFLLSAFFWFRSRDEVSFIFSIIFGMILFNIIYWVIWGRRYYKRFESTAEEKKMKKVAKETLEKDLETGKVETDQMGKVTTKGHAFEGENLPGSWQNKFVGVIVIIIFLSFLYNNYYKTDEETPTEEIISIEDFKWKCNNEGGRIENETCFINDTSIKYEDYIWAIKEITNDEFMKCIEEEGNLEKITECYKIEESEEYFKCMEESGQREIYEKCLERR